jgi:hypothetical protein
MFRLPLTRLSAPHILTREWMYTKNGGAAVTGIQFLTDDKGQRVAVQIDLKKHGAIWEDFWDGLISESRRKEKNVPYEQYRASRLKRSRSRG